MGDETKEIKYPLFGYIFMKGCPFCDKFKTIWDSVKPEDIEGVNMMMFNCDDATDKATLQNIHKSVSVKCEENPDGKVESFPTIFFMKNKEIKEPDFFIYKDDTTKETVIEFVKEKMKKDESHAVPAAGGRRRRRSRRSQRGGYALYSKSKSSSHRRKSRRQRSRSSRRHKSSSARK